MHQLARRTSLQATQCLKHKSKPYSAVPVIPAYSNNHRLFRQSLSSTSKLPAIRPIGTRHLSSSARRSLATPVDEIPEDQDPFDLAKIERVSDEVDVCIVGGGPAGLSAAIRIMQLAKEQGKEDLRVIVLEKGGEIGESLLTSVWL